MFGIHASIFCLSIFHSKFSRTNKHKMPCQGYARLSINFMFCFFHFILLYVNFCETLTLLSGVWVRSAVSNPIRWLRNYAWLVVYWNENEKWRESIHQTRLLQSLVDREWWYGLRGQRQIHDGHISKIGRHLTRFRLLNSILLSLWIPINSICGFLEIIVEFEIRWIVSRASCIINQ